jgi:hypothetical protein
MEYVKNCGSWTNVHVMAFCEFKQLKQPNGSLIWGETDTPSTFTDADGKTYFMYSVSIARRYIIAYQTAYNCCFWKAFMAFMRARFKERLHTDANMNDGHVWLKFDRSNACRELHEAAKVFVEPYESKVPSLVAIVRNSLKDKAYEMRSIALECHQHGLQRTLFLIDALLSEPRQPLSRSVRL